MSKIGADSLEKSVFTSGIFPLFFRKHLSVLRSNT